MRHLHALLAASLALASVSARDAGALQLVEPALATELPRLLAVETAGPDFALDLEDLGLRVGTELRAANRFGPRAMQALELASATSGDARRALVARLHEQPEVRFATLVRADSAGNPWAPTRWILLRFERSVPAAVQRAVLDSQVGLTVERERFGGMDGAWRLESLAATGDEVLAQAAALRALPGVKWAHPDRVLTDVSSDLVPTDPLYPNAWGLDNQGLAFDPGGMIPGLVGFDMNMEAAWDFGTGSNGVIVAVFDNGVQTNHPDLNMGPAADFTGSGTGGGPVNACGRHGTAVAGCVAAILNNGIGALGTAPGCRVASASVSVPNMPCDGSNSGLASWKVDALDWAQGIGARITNWSFTMEEDDAVSDKLNETEEDGDMIHFAAAGNDSADVGSAFPANDPSTLAVGSVRWDGVVSAFSNTGPEVEFVAPGEQIQTTDITGAGGYTSADYVMIDGTSFSSPYAAGVAALIVSRQPAADSFDVERCLEMGARDMGSLGEDNQHGCGLIDARHTLVILDHDFDAMQTDWKRVSLLGGFGVYNNVSDAIAALQSGGLLIVEKGSYDEALIIDKPLTLRRWDAPIVIGK